MTKHPERENDGAAPEDALLEPEILDEDAPLEELIDADADAVEGLQDGEVERRRVRIRIRRKLPGRRLDKYLHGRFKQKISRTILQKLIKKGEILVNGKPTKNSYEMETGDVVDITFPPPEPYDVVPENIPLNVIYEDDYLLAINKPAGIIIHPARRSQTGTIANALAYYSNTLSKCTDPFRPGIVHRLDKNTTGVLIVAKTDEVHWRLAIQFENRTTEKIYLAVVHGSPAFDEDVIEVAIGKHPTVHDRYIATGFAERMGGKFEKKFGKAAVTRYKVLERFRGYSLMELYPKTGRTHQLRIHMSHLGHPIVGDPFYGGRNVSLRQITDDEADSNEPRYCRQMLHAHRLAVEHPITKERLQLSAPPPEDMQELIDLLRRHCAKGKR